MASIAGITIYTSPKTIVIHVSVNMRTKSSSKEDAKSPITASTGVTKMCVGVAHNQK